MASPEIMAATPENLSHEDLRIRRRSAIACRNCSRRKVRCNVSNSGQPCANCQHDRVQCEVPARKKQGPRKRLVLPHPDGPRAKRAGSGPRGDSPSVEPHSPHPQGLAVRDAPPAPPGLPSVSVGYRAALSIASLSVVGDSAWGGGYLLAPDSDESADGALGGRGVDAGAVPVVESNTVQALAGNRGDPRDILHDMFRSPAEMGNHFLVPQVMAKTYRPEELAYLRFKGAFSVPSREICEDLIKCYFHNVHPFLPIIGAGHFLDEFTFHGLQQLSLLRLWSMFFAASNFVDVDVLHRSGYESRTAMKQAMYQRAKCLYDMDYEEDKLALVQSVLLLAFCCSHGEEKTGAWHWLGVAISLCQAMGLHHSPESTPNHSLPNAQISALKRIWWSCVVYDRWLSVSLGRPMRIRSEECDISMPTAGDVIMDLRSLPPLQERYVPVEGEWIAGLWVKLVKITDVLGSIISIFYKQESRRPGYADMDRCERLLMQCAPSIEGRRISDPISLLHMYQLQLFYEAVVIALQWPYVFLPPGTILREEDQWQADSHRKAKAAAANINAVLEGLIDSNMIKFLEPMTITTLIPAMHMHLLESTSATALSRHFGQHKFQLCMIVLSELSSSHPRANMIKGLFEQAQSRVIDTDAHRPSPPQPNTPPNGLPLPRDFYPGSASGGGGVGAEPVQSARSGHATPSSLSQSHQYLNLNPPPANATDTTPVWHPPNPFLVLPEANLGVDVGALARAEGGKDWGRFLGGEDGGEGGAVRGGGVREINVLIAPENFAAG